MIEKADTKNDVNKQLIHSNSGSEVLFNTNCPHSVPETVPAHIYYIGISLGEP